jgi:short-subunit dehydrogenase
MKQANIHYYTLITGAGMGLGKELAIECARRKMNLILVALPGESLPAFAENLKVNYKVDAIAIEKDLCVEGSSRELFQHVEGLHLQVNMLINNAGIGSTQFFTEGSFSHFETSILLNVMAPTLITRYFMPMLKQNSPSYILNVGSLASFFSLPKKQVYGGTKSYIHYFSKSLAQELKPDQVYVSVLCPGGMFTNERVKRAIESGNYISRASSMEPNDVAVIALNSLLKKKPIIIPGKINNIFLFLHSILPGFINRYLENLATKKIKE